MNDSYETDESPLDRLRVGDTIGNDRSADMNRVERGIVRGLQGEFGPGQQHQHGDSQGFSIAVAGTRVLISVKEVPDV